MYDSLSVDYDRFVDWPTRLAAELPFVEQNLRAVGATRVLDAACGTGMHALALAQQGFQVAGTDLSEGMVARARENGRQAGVDVRFEAAGFGQLHADVGSDFDALLCLGNSLPHVLDANTLAAALADFSACLRPGGLVLIQNRNFDRVLAQGERWMTPQSRRDGDREWVFVRFYDFEPDGLLGFHLVTLARDRGGGWRQQIASTRLWPLRQAELVTAMSAAGFEAIASYGDMAGAGFDAETSGNLVVVGLAAG